MTITDIRIRKTYDDARLKALVSVTIDGDLAVHDIKVIEGPERLFVAMPSRKDENGTFRDIAHPSPPPPGGPWRTPSSPSMPSTWRGWPPMTRRPTPPAPGQPEKAPRRIPP